MKRLLPLLFFLFVCVCFAQKEQSLFPTELDDKSKQLLMSIPDLPVPEHVISRSIPYKINNSQTPYYRTPFPQDGLSCGQASSVGMCFTYEIAKKRDLPANVNANLYPTHFVYNWANGGSGAGASYYHTLEVLKNVGTPNQEEYGGTPHFGGVSRWMSGYDLYYSAMHNRLRNAYKIDIRNAEGMQILKNWLYDAFKGETPGGCAITYTSNRYPNGTLPAGTEEAGMFVITSGSMSSSHSITICGYNDSIRFDYNGDGRFTNDVDINGDGIVDMRDWEIGGLIISETFFGATAWGNNGFCYLTYKAVADGYFWNYLVHVMEVNHTYTPLLTAKVGLTHTRRGRIKVYAGVSTNMSATTPDHIMDFPIFNYQGGEQYMQGGTNNISNTSIEFGLDLTPLLNYVEAGAPAKFFLQVYENDPQNIAHGTIDYFSILDYGGAIPVEIACEQQNVGIINNSVTTLSVIVTPTFSPVEISTGNIPPVVVMSEYSTQLEANGGSEPYRWYFDTDYQTEQTHTEFPTGGTATSNNAAINLPFTFPFYEEEFSIVYMNSKGLLVFEPNFGTTLPYANVGLETQIFNNKRCITPYHTNTVQATQMRYISNANSATFIWNTSVMNYAVTIYSDGSITFCYQQATLPHNTPYIAGVSDGDGENYTTVVFPNNFTVPQGLSYNFTRNSSPEDFVISLTGEITGIPIREYVDESIYIKVVDNNGLINRKTFSMSTEGVILDYVVHTPNNDVIGYNETVTLDLVVQNPFPIHLQNISITAICNDPYITLINGHATLSALNGNSTEVIANAFSFYVAGNVPNNYRFRMNFQVETGENTWNYHKSFSAYAPQFFIGTITVNDGNDNILTHSETVQISVPVKNIGEIPVNQVSITLSTDDPNFIISSSPAVFNINVDETVNFTGTVTTASTIAQTYTGTLHLNISGDGGFEQRIPFELMVYAPDIAISQLKNINNFIPGETRNITFVLQNVGVVPASNITASVRSENGKITVNTPAQNLSLDIENSTEMVYSISLSNHCQYGEQIACYITVTGSGGLNYNIPFIITVGAVMEDFETGDFLDVIDWTHTGAANWYIVTDDVYEGQYALRSGGITHNEFTAIETEIFVLTPGNVTFAYKVSSENNYDWFRFYVDGVRVRQASGSVGWLNFYYPLTEGFHTLKWSYEKDLSISAGADAAWIDNISLPPFNNAASHLVALNQEITITMFPDKADSAILTLANQGGQFEDYLVNIFTAEPPGRSLLGSYLTTEMTSYQPGETYDIPFIINCSSIDNEWIKTVKIQFPEEFTVNSASNITGSRGTLTWIPVTGNGIEAIWTIETQYGAIISGDVVSFTVNVTIDEDYRSQSSTLHYELIGDISGSAPHEVSGSVVLQNTADFWLTIAQPQGRGYPAVHSDIVLAFNTYGLDTGIYYADLKVITPERRIIIPVELKVILEENSIRETTVRNEQLKCHPNPFTDVIEVTYFTKEVTQIDKISLFDITGKELRMLDYNKQTLPGENRFTYRLGDLPAGIYMLRVVSNSGVLNHKVVKQ